MRQQIEEQQRMHDFFISVWDSKRADELICYESGKRLLGPPTSVNFHHVLEKSKYPQYKFSAWNIVLVSWIVHDQAHWNIDKTPRIKALRWQLLEDHKQGKLKP